MKYNTEEKSLISIENNIFYKIKRFFQKLFSKEIEIEEKSNIIIKNNKKKNEFLESLRNIENEETKLLKLQKQFRNGEIKAEQLTKKQKIALSKLYDEQISRLKKSNEIRRKRLLKN